MFTSWHSYPKIFSLGHRAVKDLLSVPHMIQEKIDGSQFSFGVFEEPCPNCNETYIPYNGPDPCPTCQGSGFIRDLKVRSKGVVMLTDAPDKMFNKAVQAVKDVQHLLHVGWTYRGEYLQSPNHNALRYDRVPTNYIMLFDISTGEEEWLGVKELQEEAKRLGFESVPILEVDYIGGLTTFESLRATIDNTVSCLGGQKIEGIVVKQLGMQNPNVEARKDLLLGTDKKTLIAKFVSERFKEVHAKVWGENNPKSGDILEKLGEVYRSEARWHKAIQHLRERGELEDSPRDIPKIIKEVQNDVLEEELDSIKEMLFTWAKPHLTRSVIRGVPEWYKNELLRRQFATGLETIVPDMESGLC